MVDLSVFLLPVRAVQALFSVIVLGTLAASASDWNHYFLFDGTPSSIAFLIFCAVWTWLALAYLILAPMVLPAAHHHFAVLAVEAVTMIFWFAGFIALAAGLNNNCVAIFQGCKTAAAGDAFAAFEWALFVFTLVVAILTSFGRRGSKVATTNTAPAMTVP